MRPPIRQRRKAFAFGTVDCAKLAACHEPRDQPVAMTMGQIDAAERKL